MKKAYCYLLLATGIGLFGCDPTTDDDEGAFQNEALAIELEWEANVDLDLSVDVPAGLSQATDFKGGEDVMTGPGYEYLVSKDDRSDSEFDGDYTISVTLTMDGEKPGVQPIPFEVQVTALGTTETFTSAVRSVVGQLTREIRLTKEGNTLTVD